MRLVALGLSLRDGKVTHHGVERLRQQPEFVVAANRRALAEVTLGDGASPLRQNPEWRRQPLTEEDCQQERRQQGEQQGQGERKTEQPLQAETGQRQFLVLGGGRPHRLGIARHLVGHALDQRQCQYLTFGGVERDNDPQEQATFGSGDDGAVRLLHADVAHGGRRWHLRHQAGGLVTRERQHLARPADDRRLLDRGLLAQRVEGIDAVAWRAVRQRNGHGHRLAAQIPEHAVEHIATE